MTEKPAGILNYSTTVPVARTVGEVQALLAKAGALTVSVQYDAGQPAGVGFTLNTPVGVQAYVLPVEVHKVLKVLVEQERARLLRGTRPPGGWGSGQHAARVAWRIAKDWLEAQTALITAHMATADQIMLPYMTTGGTDPDTGRELTVYDRFTSTALGTPALEGTPR